MGKRKTEIIKGIICSYCLTLIVICSLSAIYTYTQFSEEFTPIIINLTRSVSIAVGSFISSKKIKNMGWLNGVVISIVYTAILVAIGVFLKGNVYCITKSLGNLVINIFIGMVFGIIGVNVKK